MVVKTCRFISLILVFVLLFNFFSQQVVYAMPAVLVGYGLIAFAAALTAYGITISDNSYVKTLYSSFQEWCNDVGWTEYLQNSYHQNKMMLMGIPFCVAALGVGLNTWIRDMFNSGYNQLAFVGNDVKFYSVNVGVEKEYLTRKVGSRLELSCSYNGSTYNGYIQLVRQVSDYDPALLELNFNGEKKIIEIKEYNGRIYECQGMRLKFEVINGNKLRLTGKGLYPGYGGYASSVKFIDYDLGSSYYDTSFDRIPIYYSASEAVDYPVGKNPEDREMNLPPPYLGNPNIDVTDAGVVFNGTPDEFLEQIGSNQDYIDKAFDNILNPSNAISKPIVNESEGTITWPNTGTVGWPVNPPIVNPPVTVPDTAEQGIGETNSILTGISEYVGNIFAAPTKTIDFSPLMSIQLTDRFPFCLPFDLRDLIQRFQAERKAPEFEIFWKVRDVEVKYKIEFSQFEKLAEITRWGVFVTFCVGLLLVSRKLIGGE